MPLPRRPLVLLVVATAAVLALAAVFLTWVPQGSLLLRSGRALGPGLRVAPAWRPRVLVPLAADRTLGSVPVAGRVPWEAEVACRLEADAAALRLDPAAVASAGGLAPFLATRAAAAISALAEREPGLDPLLVAFRDEAASAVERELSVDGL